MHSSLIEQCVPVLEACASQGRLIDVACGKGRNGLFLANRGLAVTFADRSEASLAEVSEALNASESESNSDTWQIDLESPDINPFENKQFSAALVFRYLHRPLLPHLMKAIIPGGIVIYETFTLENKQFGRPNNPQFLLQSGELENWFNEWETLHYFEGILSGPDRAVAQIVCRKPINNRVNDNSMHNSAIDENKVHNNTINNKLKRENG